MATPTFIPQIDIQTYTETDRGLRPQSLSYFTNVFTKLSTATIDDAFLYLQQTTGLFRTCFDVTELNSTDDIVSLLDSGAERVCVTSSQLKELDRVQNLDLTRLVVVADPTTTDNGGQCGGILLQASSVEELNGYASEPIGAFKHRYILVENAVGIGSSAILKQDNTTIITPATQITIDSSAESGLESAAKLLLGRSNSDREDGLYTTLVTDERGIALGLVYSSEQSVAESLKTGRGVYQSRKRGLWYKGETSGDIQELVRVSTDCDSDCLRFTVRQKGKGFCHLGTSTCFGQYSGLSKLQRTLQERKASAPEGSYTARLFNDAPLLKAKIMEEAQELCEATSKGDVAFEAADLIYFALTKAVSAGVTLEDIEQNLDSKSVKVKRRKGDAKVPIASQGTTNGQAANGNGAQAENREMIREAESKPKSKDDPAGTDGGRIKMRRFVVADETEETIQEVLKRPSQRSTDKIMSIVKPIVEDVRQNGDAALLKYTHKFEKATSLSSPVLKAPFPESMMQLPAETIEAIDISFENIRKFHAAQQESKPLRVETMPGVVCSRFVRPIEAVGLYVPGGTAVLPSTALMLGVPAMVAGCKKIVLASPPRADGSLTPEIVYAAHKVGAESIVLAGGAQAVAAMAYGTESVTKVDKILGPGNQFVTAAKMLVSNDTSAGVSIDMPAGPSEVLVIADATANSAFVAADLLSQSEHGVDSQVVCIAVGLNESQLQAIEDELHAQATALPRVDIVRGAIEHSVTLAVRDIDTALALSNAYAPEHLILQVADAAGLVARVQNAGSVFVGEWTPESVGDYSAGVNHSLPTYGYAKQYSGVSLASYVKHITSSELTAQGLRNVGGAVMRLAEVEELEAHRRAVGIRLEYMDREGVKAAV